MYLMFAYSQYAVCMCVCILMIVMLKLFSPVQDVTYLDPFLGPKVGTLYITDYKMYFKVCSIRRGEGKGGERGGKEGGSNNECLLFQCPGVDKVGDPYILNVPLGCISHVEKMGRSRNKGEHSYGLEIHCKVSGMHVCMHVYMHVCVHVCVYRCVYLYMCVYV